MKGKKKSTPTPKNTKHQTTTTTTTTTTTNNNNNDNDNNNNSNKPQETHPPYPHRPPSPTQLSSQPLPSLSPHIFFSLPPQREYLQQNSFNSVVVLLLLVLLVLLLFSLLCVCCGLKRSGVPIPLFHTAFDIQRHPLKYYGIKNKLILLKSNKKPFLNHPNIGNLKRLIYGSKIMALKSNCLFLTLKISDRNLRRFKIPGFFRIQTLTSQFFGTQKNMIFLFIYLFCSQKKLRIGFM